ncbi:GPW/gp25 family protein [Brevundimonas terrae]|uniref:GPW/gp25 family protein n=1 Tax=Brevundimonas terrae TaxID=363631 RepID=A0ABN0YGG1_9CAUL|nr:GPW/gp25 family protein [Brevundimonas terrae]NIJ26917.1 hypothetical protein [Brevundimonas terrae]
MSGLSPVTGRAVSELDDDYIRRSVADILTTPIGSRVMRREYGSYIPELIDQPMNEQTRLKLYGATAMSLMLWSRRARIKSVRLEIDDHSACLKLDLVRTDLPRPRRIIQSLPLSLI